MRTGCDRIHQTMVVLVAGRCTGLAVITSCADSSLPFVAAVLLGWSDVSSLKESGVSQCLFPTRSLGWPG
jgi:hypothetical protein